MRSAGSIIGPATTTTATSGCTTCPAIPCRPVVLTATTASAIARHPNPRTVGPAGPVCPDTPGRSAVTLCHAPLRRCQSVDSYKRCDVDCGDVITSTIASRITRIAPTTTTGSAMTPATASKRVPSATAPFTAATTPRSTGMRLASSQVFDVGSIASAKTPFTTFCDRKVRSENRVTTIGTIVTVGFGGYSYPAGTGAANRYGFR